MFFVVSGVLPNAEGSPTIYTPNDSQRVRAQVFKNGLKSPRLLITTAFRLRSGAAGDNFINNIAHQLISGDDKTTTDFIAFDVYR